MTARMACTMSVSYTHLLAEKRCLGEGPDYTGFILARESGSIGTAVSVYDPIAGRKVELLSQGEAELFWIIRFRDGVKAVSYTHLDVYKRQRMYHGRIKMADLTGRALKNG